MSDTIIMRQVTCGGCGINLTVDGTADKVKCHTCNAISYTDGKWCINCGMLTRWTGEICRKCEKVQKEDVPTLDMVNHPAHYGGVDNPYETIKVLEAWLTPEQLIGYCLGNTIKYLSRMDKKEDRIQDAKKAKWYLDYMVEFMQRNSH